MTHFRLRGYAIGYALVTRETRAVTRVTRKSRVRVHESVFPCVAINYQFRSIRKSTRNRVTHVTTGNSRVTARVTNILSRNQKKG